MSFRTLTITVLAPLVCCAAAAELGFQVSWQIDGAGGFSAANALVDPATGDMIALVATEANTGVVCLDAAGVRLWEYPMEPPVTTSPAVADVNGDGRDDIVAADSKGNLVALNADGALVWSSRTRGGVVADSCPAIADLDGDGAAEILVGDTSGALSCFANDGTLRWQFSGDGTQMGPVLVADLYDAGGAEIVVTSHDGHIYALTARGEWLWDLYFQDDLFPNSTPILADVDGDNVPELYVGGGLHHFYRIDLAEHRAVLVENVYLHVNNAINAADLEGDGKDVVVFGNKGGAVYCYGDGGFQWTKELRESSMYAAPVFVNLDDDADLEILLYSARGDIHVFEPDGSEIASSQSPFKATTSPLVGDLDADGMAELVVSQPGHTTGKGAMAWIELGVPFADSPSVCTVFAGDRAHSGRAPGAKAYPPLPTPTTKAGPGNASVDAVGKPTLLTGPNTWRFDVHNPDLERLVLLTDVAYPDGSVHHFARHVHGPAERALISFEIAMPGTYAIERRLVNGDLLTSQAPTTRQMTFEGFGNDETYLNDVVFAEGDRAVEAWRTSNPASADYFRSELVALKGMLAHLAGSDQAGRASLLADLRDRAQRLRALATAGQQLAPTGSFFAWEFTPWAYFDGRDTLPAAENRTDTLSASLCVGEYESLALNVTNVSGDSLDIRVSCGDLEGPATVLSRMHVEFRRAVTVPTIRRERVADALPLLDEAGLIAVPSLESRQLWITVNAVGLEPGEYEADLRLKSIEPDPTEIHLPFTIVVHDLALPRPRPLRFCLWAYDGSTLGTDKPHILDDLVNHGMTVLFGRPPRATCNADGALEGPLDFTAHDEAVARLSPHGMMLFTGPQGGVRGQPFLSEPWRKAFVVFMREWAAHMKELGLEYDQWALYPYDEPSSPYTETTLNLVEVAKLVREADPNVWIYTDPTSGTTMESVEMLTGLIDVWCPSAELLERLGPELVPVAHRVGKEVWFYDAAGRAKTLSCLGIYRWRFWYGWNLGFTGAGWWCYGRPTKDLWDGPNETGDHFDTVYESPGGVVSSKRWEVAREGVEDYEYLYMLREAIRDAEARGVPEDQLLAARTLLEELPKEIEEALYRAGRRLPLTPDSVPLYAHTTVQLEEARQAIVEACLQLKRAAP